MMKTLIRIFVVAASFVLPVIARAQSLPQESRFFLKVEGIPGESNATGHVGEIDVVSFKLGVSQTRISDFGGGAGAGKSVFEPLRIFKYADKASPLLFLSCATGKFIPSIVLTAERGDDPPFKYLEIKLSDVLISSVNHESADQDGVNLLLESVSLNFTKVEFRYIPQGSNGAPGSPVVVGFDLKKNKVVQIAPPAL